jgi:hypothetical protein
MKHERVTGQNVDLGQLMASIQNQLSSQGFQILQNESAPNYRVVHARKGGLGRTLIGAVRDAEVDVAGSNENFELTLRTGAWGRDIAIPAVEGFVILGPIGAGGGAAAGAIVAYEFERNFWKWLGSEVQRLSGGAGRLSQPYSPAMVAPTTLTGGGSSGPNPGGSGGALPSSGSPGSSGTPGYSGSSASPQSGTRCAGCGNAIPAGARFCPTCGRAAP